MLICWLLRQRATQTSLFRFMFLQSLRTCKPTNARAPLLEDCCASLLKTTSIHSAYLTPTLCPFLQSLESTFFFFVLFAQTEFIPSLLKIGQILDTIPAPDSICDFRPTQTGRIFGAAEQSCTSETADTSVPHGDGTLKDIKALSLSRLCRESRSATEAAEFAQSLTEAKAIDHRRGTGEKIRRLCIKSTQTKPDVGGREERFENTMGTKS